jgi:hypothetical protein
LPPNDFSNDTCVIWKDQNTFISNLYFCVEKGKMKKKKNIMDSMWISIMFFPHFLEFLLMSLKYNKIQKKKQI